MAVLAYGIKLLIVISQNTLFYTFEKMTKFIYWIESLV